ncbi:MAG: Rrf2 family transcriptional regulator [Actinomycetota bacterium]|nr:Rrf2 family transcriptional regulator [Actinomycetota bacterium]
MQLAPSKRGDYVVRSALALARAYESGEPKKLRQIAAETGVPRTFVSQILGDLVRSGLAISSFGVHGGYRLSRPPERMSLLEVVEAGEGTQATGHVVPGADGQWRPEGALPLDDVWRRASEAFRSVLATTSLADLTPQGEDVDAGTSPTTSARSAVPTVAVFDDVQIELGAATVAERLQASGSWLARHASAASAEGEAVRVRVGPGGPAWLGKTVGVHLGPVRDTEGTLAIPVTWEATGPSALFPRLEGELRVVPIDPDRSQLSLAGRYRPPLGRAGLVLDEVLLVHVARAAVRSFLRQIAWALEETARSRPAELTGGLGLRPPELLGTPNGVRAPEPGSSTRRAAPPPPIEPRKERAQR